MAIDPTAVIHASALIDDGARIGPGCRIGPYCVVGADVALDRDVELISHVSLAGVTEIGAESRIWPFAAVGHMPQDLKYAGERSELIVGARSHIREHATMHPGTADGGGITRVGEGGLYMIGTHVAHDCRIGDGVIMSNNASLAGHVVIEDRAILGGFAVIHQFVRIGRGAMVGGMTAVVGDVIPFGSAVGPRGALAGLNLIGLKRAGVDRGQIHDLRAAFDELFSGAGSLSERMAGVRERHGENPLVSEILTFMSAETSRSYTIPAAG